MVISWLRHISDLFHLCPIILAGVKLVSILRVIVIANSSEDDDGVAKYGGGMMRQLPWLCALAVNWLPGYTVLWILDKGLDTLNGESPHVAHWSLLNVSSSVDVEVVIHDETAVVRSSLRQFS